MKAEIGLKMLEMCRYCCTSCMSFINICVTDVPFFCVCLQFELSEGAV